MYIGCARNSNDVERALLLAAKTFRANETVDAAVDVKRHLMSPERGICKQDVVVIANEEDEVAGTCFLIDRPFFRSGNKLKGTFLSSICIAEKSRGMGYSAPLMNHAIAECERRGSAFSILIARRAVDRFYNRFNFWGLSQYSKIHINLKEIPASSNFLTIYPVTEDDLTSVNSLYESTYSPLLGACERSVEYWRHVLWKTEKQNIAFVVFRMRGAICGYAMFSGSEVYEVASKSEVPCLDLLHHVGKVYSLTNISLDGSPLHRIVHELCSFDFSVANRQCIYGGHMVRIVNHDVLLKMWEEELRGMFLKLGAKDFLGVSEDFVIELKEGKVSVTLTSSPFNYENTSNLMGASSLSTTQRMQPLFKQSPFNVPLVDQS